MDDRTPTRPPIIWFADMPADFHNPEPWAKVSGLREGGHRVVVFDQLGVANPRPRNMGKLVRYARRRIRRGTDDGAGGGPRASRQLVIVPPRHHRVTDRVNDRLLMRQIGPVARGLGAPPILWFRFPTPELVRLIGRLGEALVVYDCVDRYAAFGYPPRATRALVAAETRLLGHADLTLVTSAGLREFAAPLTRTTLLHPNGIDLARFAHRRPVPEDLAALPRPLLGYTGAVDERVDIALMADVARAHPGGSVVIVGEVAPGVDAGALTRLPNVHVMGYRPHDDMPGYIGALDVGLLPYRRTEVTASVFPVKSLEYLAAGLPCVATDLPELRRFASAMTIAATPGAYIAGVAHALGDRDPAAAERRGALVAGYDWDHLNRALVAAVASASRR